MSDLRTLFVTDPGLHVQFKVGEGNHDYITVKLEKGGRLSIRSAWEPIDVRPEVANTISVGLHQWR